jgi:hypothetical protein
VIWRIALERDPSQAVQQERQQFIGLNVLFTHQKFIEDGAACSQSRETMSSDVLGMLAALHQRVEKSRCRLAISGLKPVLRNMLRICRLERVFNLHADEAEPSGAAAQSDILGASASKS